MAYGITNPDTGSQTGGTVGASWEQSGVGAGGGGDALGALIGLASVLANNYANKKRQIDQNKWNEQQSALAYQRDVDFWHMKNKYDSPAEMMARLSAAGLNPHMVGQTGSAGGGSGQAPSARIPEFTAPGSVLSNLPNLVSMYQGLSMQKAQIDNVKAQTDNIQSRTFNESLRGNLMNIQGMYINQKNRREGTKLDYAKAKFLQDYEHKESMNPIEISRAMFARDSERELFPYSLEGQKYGVQRARYGVQEQLGKLSLMRQQEQLNALRAHAMRQNLTAGQLDMERVATDTILKQRQTSQIDKKMTGESGNDSGLIQSIVRGLITLF